MVDKNRSSEILKDRIAKDPGIRYLVKNLIFNFGCRDPLDMYKDLELTLTYYKLKLAEMGIPMSGAELISEERRRQIEVEGWTPEHDEQHACSELAMAATCYIYSYVNGDYSLPHLDWPWDKEWCKPTPDDPIRQFVKAGALIAAEIDRLQRIKTKSVNDPCPHGMSVCDDCGEQCEYRGQYGKRLKEIK